MVFAEPCGLREQFFYGASIASRETELLNLARIIAYADKQRPLIVGRRRRFSAGGLASGVLAVGGVVFCCGAGLVFGFCQPLTKTSEKIHNPRIKSEIVRRILPPCDTKIHLIWFGIIIELEVIAISLLFQYRDPIYSEVALR